MNIQLSVGFVILLAAACSRGTPPNSTNRGTPPDTASRGTTPDSADRGLTHDSAKIVIDRSSLIRSTDSVTVDAISSTSPTEAVVRATIHGHTTNLKFRQFDNGWTWEFVETKTAGWVSPDIAIAQIREEDRTTAAAAWAEQNRAAYATTAEALHILSIYNAPNPTELQNSEAYMKLRDQMMNMLKADKRPEMQGRFAVMSNAHPADAWGTEIKAKFAQKDDSTVIFSAGPDRVAGTADDLVCSNTFRRGFEDGREVWEHLRTWTLPEDLGGVVDPFIDKRTDRVAFTKVVHP